jgi:hypothetical protein
MQNNLLHIFATIDQEGLKQMLSQIFNDRPAIQIGYHNCKTK